MYKRCNYSVKEIKSHYTGTKARMEQEKHGFFFRRIIRPISFYLTPPFLILCISANQVTILSFIMGLTGVGLLTTGDYYLMLTGSFLLLIFLMLDFIDGNIARFQKKTSHFGKFLDGVSGNVIYTLIPFCLGTGSINASHESDLIALSPGSAVIVSFVFSYLFTFSLYIRWRFRAQKLLMTEENHSPNTEDKNPQAEPSGILPQSGNHASSFKGKLKSCALNFLHRVNLAWQNLYIPSLLLLAIPGFSSTTLLIICAIAGIYSSSYILFTFYNAATILNKYRAF